MSINPPHQPPSRRYTEHRNTVINFSPTSSTEALFGPIRETVPMLDRLIVGLDFGTTYSG